MFNDYFCAMNIKKKLPIVGGGGCVGRGEVQLQYLLGYPSLLLGHPSNIHTCMLCVYIELLIFLYYMFV